ncbi:5'-3' exonuclease H3TH domain-containing protein [Phyllobacterium myrsinacearum]|uniref:5'-3' exonuclease n=1 Tax=Phyllobacterium myrsinacearum TaxID=28101 RepID=A0A839EWU2_9HYPH|nr:5'-3' exonuclease H3TH domain-containing protein [Phyllobacterium myrsinacearum]MBA8881776.1 5'-3' exonuclease [Phyllobacterium myrsinacearum]
MKRYLLIDGNNIAHAANGTKNKLTVGSVETTAIFGFLRQLRKQISIYGQFTPIVLWDGASWRKMQYKDYKENREKNDTAAAQKQKAERESTKKQIPAIQKALQLLGVTQIKAANMEADDLAAICADRYIKQGAGVVLVSGDKDWLQLVGPNCMWFDPINDRKVRTVADLADEKNKLGIAVKSFKQFVEMKALMGDTGDNIPGVGGIGDKGAMEFLAEFESYSNFSNMCLTGEVDLKKLPKKFRDLAESEDKRILFMRNLMLMDLRHPARPAPINLKVDPGSPSIETFTLFCQRLVFKSFLTDIENWVSVFPPFKYREAAAA